MHFNDDFILTLDSEPEDIPAIPPKKSKAEPRDKQQVGPLDEDAALDPEFSFDLGGGIEDDWDTGAVGQGEDVVIPAKPKRITVDDIIERRKAQASASSKKRKREEDSDDDDDDDSSDAESDGDDSSAISIDSDEESESESAEDMDDDSEADSSTDGEQGKPNFLIDPGSEESEEESEGERAKKAAFFAPDQPDDEQTAQKSFLNMNLSRPVLRAIEAMSFEKPTPIQRKAIPMALQGLDVLGSAVTGSGKTAAFMIPILERLMFKEKGRSAETRVLILTPTRELAVQCADVGKRLAQFMDVTFAVIVGGLPLRAQESMLRSRPDIVIATPGRLIDHLHNTPSFSLSALDILVLDEADRMLSDGFAAELAEIIQSCPKNRQTMLFSATMTDDVDSLVRLSMNRPLRLFVDPKKTVAKALLQEFVRVRDEENRQAILATVCKRTAKRRAIIFFRSKLLCHQMKVVFGLLGLRAAELHGNLKQEMRLESLRKFRDGEVDYLLATDVASRGLDIKGVETVINYDMPGAIELYLHRVGRTARASSKGRSISLVGEPDRRMLKAVIKRSATDKVKHRILPKESVKAMAEKISSLRSEVKEILEEEQEEKEIREGEMQITKAQNLIEHRDEILSRPKRTWFQSGKEKQESKDISKGQYTANFQKANEAQGGKTKKVKMTHDAKRRKLARDDMNEDKSIAAAGSFAARQLKKTQRSHKLSHLPGERRGSSFGTVAKAKRTKSKPGKMAKAGFDKEIGTRSGRPSIGEDFGPVREGARAKRGNPVSLRDKGSSKGKGKQGRASASTKVKNKAQSKGKGKRKGR